MHLLYTKTNTVLQHFLFTKILGRHKKENFEIHKEASNLKDQKKEKKILMKPYLKYKFWIHRVKRNIFYRKRKLRT